MVSVLPAHIAHEMKTEMIRKIRKAQMKSYLTDDEFVNQKSTKEVTIPVKAKKFINSSKLNSNNSNTGNNAKSTGTSIIDFAARKLSVSLRNSLKQKQNLNLNSNDIQLKPPLAARKNARAKTSGFHDLYIKSHNNVR